MALNYHIDDNGWTVILDDYDFTQATQEDINQIACWLATNTLVVARNQGRLTVADELRIANMFGDVESNVLQYFQQYIIAGDQAYWLYCLCSAKITRVI
jgi:hypothetical protein